MKFFEIINGIWANRDKIRSISDAVIKVIDALDGSIDWKKEDEKK